MNLMKKEKELLAIGWSLCGQEGEEMKTAQFSLSRFHFLFQIAFSEQQ
jgi:hypothetical protein